jgi:hypothetical protein
MTRLYIDKREVVLPDKFQLTVTEENPLFEKRGQYTLDLDLSLSHPVNANIFKHCNRPANTAEIEERSALLLVDNRVLLNGTAIALELLDDSVKIQLVSGNSELNYLGSDTSIRDLDLGVAQGNAMTDDDQLNMFYPQVDYHILSFMTNDNNWIGNSYYYVSSVIQGSPYLDNLRYWGCYKPNTGMAENFNAEFNRTINRRPQPYLNAIIRRVVEALGFTLIKNVLTEHLLFKQIHIIHGYDTLQFAKMLPDWTVTDFFSQLEALFDVTVLVDNRNKTVQILFNYSFCETTDSKELLVIDEYSCDLKSPASVTKNGKNVSYAFGSEEYYKLNRLDEAAKNKSTTVTLSSVIPIPDLLSKVGNSADSERYKKIFHYESADTDFIAYTQSGTTIAKRVDSFRNIINDDSRKDKVDVSLKMIPASFKTILLVTDKVLPSGTRKSYWMQFPVVDAYDPFIFSRDTDGNDDYSIQGLSTGNVSDSGTNISDTMRLVMYSGKQYVDLVGSGWENQSSTFEPFPICYVEDLPEYVGSVGRYRTFMVGNNPFRLKWLNDVIYKRTFGIDQKKPYKFSFFGSSMKGKITDVYIINNKKYLCSKVERVINEYGLESIVVGTFFQLNN